MRELLKLKNNILLINNMDKRHFTVVIGSKEHGLYISSKPSSAAKKAVSKLCASNKSKKVEFCLREITQGSKKKTYGPYLGEMQKLKKPIELKGRVIRYEIKVHLKNEKSSTIKTAKKMKGGEEVVYIINEGMRSNLIDRREYREVLNAIFKRNEILSNLYYKESLRNSRGDFIKNNKGKRIMQPKYYPDIFIQGMINAIDTFQENKYKFIICFIGLYSIIDYTIDTIGIDKIIEILFNTNYSEEEFSHIIASMASQTTQFNFQSSKKNLFIILLKKYLHKGEFDVLKKLLSIRDMSIMDKQFITTLLEYFMSFDEEFKLFKFLLDNKKDLLEFIRILKNINEANGRGSTAINTLFIVEPKVFGTSQQREELFRNV
jgi:hypothetical protein